MCQNILIIAPSRVAQQTLSDKLSIGYQIFTANEWIDSILLIKRQAIRLVLCLAGNKPASGFLLCRQLKSNAISAHIPIILITEEENLQVRIKALESGADVHIGGILFREYLDVQMRNLIANRVKVHQHIVKPVAAGEDQPDGDGKDQIIRKLSDCLLALQPETELGVDQLAKLMHMSRPTLYRKMKLITNLTPNELINEARLRKAAELLASGGHKVSDVARMVGYGSPSSFGKSFLKQFKVTPATYQRMKKIMDAA
jgi:two-component system cell cycle response regulator